MKKSICRECIHIGVCGFMKTYLDLVEKLEVVLLEEDVHGVKVSCDCSYYQKMEKVSRPSVYGLYKSWEK